jgi:hypothetical protein
MNFVFSFEKKKMERTSLDTYYPRTFQKEFVVMYKNGGKFSRNHDLPAIIYKERKYSEWRKNGILKRNVVFDKKTFFLHYPNMIREDGEKEYFSNSTGKMILDSDGDKYGF